MVNEIREHQEMLEILRKEYKETLSALNRAIKDKNNFEIKILRETLRRITVDGKAVRKAFDVLTNN